MRRYLLFDLLIMDDFCLAPLNPQQAEDLYQLIEERYRRGSMVVTLTEPLRTGTPLFPNPVLAEGILDRLINCAHQVVLTGSSCRPMLRPDRKNAIAEEEGAIVEYSEKPPGWGQCLAFTLGELADTPPGEIPGV